MPFVPFSCRGDAVLSSHPKSGFYGAVFTRVRVPVFVLVSTFRLMPLRYNSLTVASPLTLCPMYLAQSISPASGSSLLRKCNRQNKNVTNHVSV